MKLSDLLSFLQGSWELDRRIDDGYSGIEGRFVGRGVFEAGRLIGGGGVGGRLVYREKGVLSFGSHRGEASRQLEYVSLGGGRVAVLFADGRPFVELDLVNGSGRATHDCGADRYEITLSVLSDDLLEEHWAVEGPKKAYTALTTLRRESPVVAGRIPTRASPARRRSECTDAEGAGGGLAGE